MNKSLKNTRNKWIILVLLVAGLVVGVQGLRADTSTLTSGADYSAGRYDGTESKSFEGDLKLKAAGAWEQKGYETPDVPLTTGTSMASDGTDIYVAAGSSTWFARYSSTENSWTEMASPPHTSYYGADMEYLNGYIYLMFGGYQNTYARYDIANNTWTEMSNTPDLVYRGGSLESDGTDIYGTRGYNTTDFWKYTVSTDSWTLVTSAPATLYYGASLTYDNGYLYTPRGGNRNTYYRYEISSATWSTMATAPGTFGDDTKADIKDGYIYILKGGNTTTMYRYSISGNSWSTMAETPIATRYVGLVHHSGDDNIWVFRGNGQYDLWRYDTSSDSYSGPADLLATPGSGADLVYYSGYLYQPRGNNSTSFYRYETSSNSWESRASTPATFNDDTKGVVAGTYLYYFRGSNTTDFYRYSPSGNSWSTMAVAPATVRYGGTLIYPGSGDYIYATRGNYSRSYYRYTISTDTWDDGAVSDLPNNAEASYGARLMTDGTDIYYLSGACTGVLLKYVIGTDTWSQVALLPYAPYWGTDAIIQDGEIYIQTGYYKNEFLRYNIASGEWLTMDPLEQYFGYDQGPYNGGSLAYDTDNDVLYSIRGANTLNMASMSVGSYDYLTSGTWTSAPIDLSYVTSWTSLTSNTTTPSDSSVGYETRTSADKTTWTSWESVSGTTIVSTVQRYIQVRATLSANTARTQAASIQDISINYAGDVTDPGNPDLFSGKSTEVGGVTLTSGNTYNHNYPYFSWTGASDTESGLAGYYVYWGTNASADPETAGNYQTGSDYEVTDAMENGTYYLRVKTEDEAGNVSETVAGFSYVYQGVQYVGVEVTSEVDLLAGTLASMSATGGELKLSGKAGYWREDGLARTLANYYYGSDLAYDSSSNKLYASRGSNTNDFYEYDIDSAVWTQMADLPGNLHYGGGVVEGPSGYLYATRGYNTTSFYRYNISQNTWDDSAAADAPTSIYYGGSLVYDNSQYIYALRGNNDDTFLRYDTTGNEWTSLSSVDFGAVGEQVNNSVQYGGDLAYDGDDTVYAVQGATRTGFAAYSISGESWTQLAKTPAGVYQGGQIEYDTATGELYLIPGWDREYFYKYNPGSDTWTQLTDAPYYMGNGTAMKAVSGDMYVTRGRNSRDFWRYDISQSRWMVPTRNLFGGDYRETDYRSFYYGADLVKGDGEYLYMTRGYYDNLFIRHDPTTGETVEMAGVPSGQYVGGSLVYESTNNKIYATASQQNRKLYVYDIATNIWTEEADDELPYDPSSGASLEYDGSRYIYYARGGGGSQFYRFDTQGVVGAKWETLTSHPAGVSYGAQLVYKNGYLYTMRGNNVTPNPIYKYDPVADTWDSSLATLGDRIYNDGFLADGGGDYLFACRGGNTSSCYRYSISGDSWSGIADFPHNLYLGGSAASNGEKLYVIGGPGTGTFNTGLYTYVMQTSSTSVENSGSYISASHDLTDVYRFANLSFTYTTASNVSLTVSTRSSADNSEWESWVSATEDKAVGTSYEYKINSTPNRYLQVKFEMSSSDGVYTGSVADYMINYYSDTVLPTNASDLVAYSSASMSATLTSETWYNYDSPHFDWPDSEVAGGATDTATGSAVTGYYTYLGTDSGADPESEGTLITSSAMTASSLVSGSTYYLRIKTVDDAGNVSSGVWSPFVYKFDDTAPTAPSGVSVDPSGYSATDDFDFSWDSATDSGSAGLSYCYKTATGSGVLASDQCGSAVSVEEITSYQTGANTFYVRTRDAANNYSAYTTASFYYNSGSPSAPTSLEVTPETNTDNAFAFSWEAPTAYYGSEANLVYYYSVNALPSVASVTERSSASLSEGAYATLPGANTLYVVAMDEAGNIDYDSYVSVEFMANTTAPGIPLNTDIADVSVKATSSWKIAVSWEEPASIGAGVASYQVWRSTDGTSYENYASTSGISYVDTGLDQETYYYKIKACDNANNCGAESSTVSLLPDGKFTSPAPLVGEPTVAGITTKVANIAWTTSRTADSKVSYGTASGEYFEEEVSNSTHVTAHAIALSNLSPGTTYYFVAKWTDEDGNTGTSEEYTFSTDPAPTASEVSATTVGLDTASIQFTSNNATKAKIYYGPTTTFGGYTEVAVGTAESTYTMQLTGLEDGTKYYYKISLFDTEDEEYEGDTYSFETLPRPEVANVKLQQVKGTSTSTVLVTWVSNTAVSSIATYYPSANPGATRDKVNVKLTTTHRAMIQDLLPNTAYTLVVKGRDKAGNEAVGTAQSFTTASDTRAPVIANLKVESVIQGVGEEAVAQLVVSWDTDEASTTQVVYGEGSVGTLSSKTQQGEAMTYNHVMVVPNLRPSSVYHLKALSKDEADNEAESVDTVVITPKATKSALNLVVSNLSQAFGFLGGIAE